MADNTPPATVGQLLARVKQSTDAIEQHRAAMRQVAAEVAATPKPVPPAEVAK